MLSMHDQWPLTATCNQWLLSATFWKMSSFFSWNFEKICARQAIEFNKFTVQVSRTAQLLLLLNQGDDSNVGSCRLIV